jgi:ribosome-associated toxin RatA of RatAB toxin-antitoxin module
MNVVKKSRTVHYTCEQMFDLVDDVEQYEKFIPYCAQSVVHYRSPDEVQASLVIAAAGLHKSFTTRNLLQLHKMIEIRLVDGPFKHLEGFWRFDKVEDGCLVSFDLEFEFAGSLLTMLLGPIFEQVTNKMLDAFCTRAEELYGTS